MLAKQFGTALMAVGMTFGIAANADTAFAKGKKKASVAATKTAGKAPVKKSVVITAENKKALSSLYAGYKFGMTKAEVIESLNKAVEEMYVEKIQGTTDVMVQDRLRRDKKAEMARIAETFMEFKGKKTGWDVSLVEDQFAHNTNESMLVHWENKDGKNQRRFFFFSDGKLYKMFISLDISILPEDKRNFETFQAAMAGKYGPADVDTGKMTWNTDEFTVVAYDKLSSYAALCLAIIDPAANKTLAELRASKATAKQGPSAITKAVLDNGDEKIDINANQNAIDAVIKGK
jgi:hypothetical protein